MVLSPCSRLWGHYHPCPPVSLLRFRCRCYPWCEEGVTVATCEAAALQQGDVPWARRATRRLGVGRPAQSDSERALEARLESLRSVKPRVFPAISLSIIRHYCRRDASLRVTSHFPSTDARRRRAAVHRATVYSILALRSLSLTRPPAFRQNVDGPRFTRYWASVLSMA